MKTIKQLLRQPIKTFSGLLLMTIAASILCVCVGQAIAARTTAEELEQKFTSVAIPLSEPYEYGQSKVSNFLLDADMQAWLENVAMENPDVVKGVIRHGILSAYIPELTPWNLTSEMHITETRSWDNYENYKYQSSPYFMPYSCAMLVITLDEATEPKTTNSCITVENLTEDDFETKSDYIYWKFINPETERVIVPSSCRVELTGTITDVVSLQGGYTSPVGMTVRLTMELPTAEDMQAYDFVPGEQYIIYGMNYVNEHWKLIGSLNYDGRYDHIQGFDTYNPSWLRLLTEEEKESNALKAMRPGLQYLKYIYARYNGIDLTEYEYLKLNSISLTLNAPITSLQYEAVRDEETGKLLEVLPKTEVTYLDATGQEITVSDAGYIATYQIPTIAKLEGSVEEFLASAEGATWQAALERDVINNHAFAVIGVDDLDYLAEFAMESARVVAGRDFTDEELANGSRVCMIHETLAVQSGLQIGDTLTLSYYTTDYGLPYQRNSTNGYSLLNPSASFYFDTTPFLETAEYTIVGFYRGELLWPDVARENEYAFSANTVYVPRSSVQSEMEESESIVMNSVAIENGKLEEFQQLANVSGFGTRFRYIDQGYGTVAANFHNYQELAQQTIRVGCVIYGILLILYLLLYPVSQRKVVHTMRSLGANFGKCFGHVMIGSLVSLTISAVLGILLGTVIWDSVVSAIQESAQSDIILEPEPKMLAMIAGAQLLLAVVLNILVALVVASPRGMSRRK